MQADALLFDLGGVVVPWVGIKEMAKMTGKPEGVVLETLHQDTPYLAFETGEISSEVFLPTLMAYLQVDLTIDEVTSLWKSWVLAPYDSVLEAMNRLTSTHVLGCLSNTNTPHWERLTSFFCPDQLFDYAFASHHIGAAKPDEQAYAIALDRLGMHANQVLFFDDSHQNIEQARALGFQTCHVDSCKGVLGDLKRLQLI